MSVSVSVARIFQTLRCKRSQTVFILFFSQVLISSSKLLNQVIFIFQVVNPDSQVCLWSWITYNNLTAEAFCFASNVVFVDKHRVFFSGYFDFWFGKINLRKLSIKMILFYALLIYNRYNHDIMYCSFKHVRKGRSSTTKLIPCAEMKGKNY